MNKRLVIDQTPAGKLGCCLPAPSMHVCLLVLATAVDVTSFGFGGWGFGCICSFCMHSACCAASC